MGAGAKVLCLHCRDVIQSKNVHDFKWCSCHSVAIDGGGDYMHINYAENAKYISLKDDEDPDDHPLVGPRDTSQDREWCYICEELKFDVKISSTVNWHSRASVMNYQGQHYSIIGDML